MKKKPDGLTTDNFAEQESTVDVVKEAEEENEDKKKMSKLKKLSIAWILLTFCIYVVIDAIKIDKYGWTAINIIVTTFLALQILLFLIFTIIGAKDKKQSSRQKATMKYVKKTKKITIKLLIAITSIMMIIGVESVNFGDILAIIVAIISLILAVFSLATTIRSHVRKSKKAKEKQQKLQAKQEKQQKASDGK